jgi:hypothetical protein
MAEVVVRDLGRPVLVDARGLCRCPKEAAKVVRPEDQPACRTDRALNQEEPRVPDGCERELCQAGRGEGLGTVAGIPPAAHFAAAYHERDSVGGADRRRAFRGRRRGRDDDSRDCDRSYQQTGEAMRKRPDPLAKVTNSGSVRPPAAAVHACSKVDRYSRITRQSAGFSGSRWAYTGPAGCAGTRAAVSTREISAAGRPAVARTWQRPAADPLPQLAARLRRGSDSTSWTSTT